ncbi:MAG: hypothetical protein OEM32_07875 [Acidimicrobiia bacterium]|nr:hypothetical protein [Acidimicrobiia bacterium]
MTAILFIGIVTALGAAVRGNWSPCGESLQAQIHPLGEKARGNIWGITMASFTVASMAVGGALTAAMGWLGGMALGPGSPNVWLVTGFALAAGILDLSPVTPWTPRRQVNEDWIGRYRGWVYGAGFGAQLGLGFAVFVMSWGYWAMLAISFVAGSASLGLLFGAVFGLGRGMLLLLSRRVTTPDRLGAFHLRMAETRSLVFRATGVATIAATLVALV